MSESTQTVLVVEDHDVNRKIVRKLLQDRYCVIEAVNGLEALRALEEHPGIGVILLDLVMPVMDGFAFLEKLKGTGNAAIPVIVMTGSEDRSTEIKALQAGAIDFVRKPVDREILLSRTENAMIRNQMVLLQRMEFMATHDSLTKLYNRTKMFEETRKLLDQNPGTAFAFVRFDIDKFRLYNTAMGEQEGDRLLLFIAAALRKMALEFDTCTYGRVDADVFCMCEPYDKATILNHVKIAQRELTAYRTDYLIDTSFGVYVIDDASLNVETIFTRASMAADHCKNLYEKHVAFYDAGMSEAIAEEQEITNEMRAALEQEQFVVYLQPKYDLDCDLPCGAEALVRWRHPEKGLISPGKFIPVFEKNGFIATLDYYMWEHVCKLLHGWLAAGRQVYPVSVNMSRVSLFNPHVDELIVALVQKYEVPPKYLHLEVTESAYMDNPEMMGGTIDRLRKAGFVILMDDFGSGYSSLNTLKEISIDVLKLDMKFMPNGDDHGKSEKIISAIVRMAGWLGMDVIAEGVETVEQKNFLASIGCGYVQGYYYAKPMPVPDYEKLIAESTPVMHLGKSTGADSANGLAVWSSDAQVAALLAGIEAPVALYEYTPNHVELVRANAAFTALYGKKTYDATHGTLSTDDNWKLARAMRRAAETGQPTLCEFAVILQDGSCRWMRMRARRAAEIPQAVVLCCLFEEITQEKIFMDRFEKIAARFETPNEKKKLLVVDDAEVSRAMLGSMFGEKYEILEAADGIEGLALLKENLPDLAAILLDVIMPQMDGREFLQQKNALPEAADIPVIVISAESDSAVQLGMLRSGVSDYIVKPFDSNLAQQRVENAMAYQSRFKQLVAEYRTLRAGGSER